MDVSLGSTTTGVLSICFCLPDCSLDVIVYPEGPATGHRDISVLSFLANADTVPKFPVAPAGV
jgi:hypothetical protein